MACCGTREPYPTYMYAKCRNNSNNDGDDDDDNNNNDNNNLFPKYPFHGRNV